MNLTALEPRDCPAVVPGTGYEADYLVSLGFAHPDAVSVASITWRHDAAGNPVTDGPDVAIAGGEGDGPRVVVINGAPRRLDPGEGALTTLREPDVLASFFVPGFDPETYRGGLRLYPVLTQGLRYDAPGQYLVAAPASHGAGSVVTEIPAGDPAGAKPSLIFGDTWRGSFDLKVWDMTGDGAQDLIALAGEGGAPRVVVRDGLTGEVVSSFFAGPPEERQTDLEQYKIRWVGVQTYPGGPPTGLTVETPTGEVRFFALDGAEIG